MHKVVCSCVHKYQAHQIQYSTSCKSTSTPPLYWIHTPYKEGSSVGTCEIEGIRHGFEIFPTLEHVGSQVIGLIECRLLLHVALEADMCCVVLCYVVLNVFSSDGLKYVLYVIFFIPLMSVMSSPWWEYTVKDG